MAYQALYRKWRPKSFEDVIGQKHITETIKNEIIKNRIAHAYLFCGIRGTGKTTAAKILSRAVNCLSPYNGNPCNECYNCKGILDGSILDVVEIDAASNNGVDNIRQIREEVVYPPSTAKFKVYIIDEVHMLSAGAFNALLKTLEEPPSYVIFILATTEPHKIPATILSRCQRFDFRRISLDDIYNHLSLIAHNNNVEIEAQGLRLIAKIADGSMRDGLSILEQCIGLGQKISLQQIEDAIGTISNSYLFNIAAYVAQQNIQQMLKTLDSIINQGKDIFVFMEELTYHYRNLLIAKLTVSSEGILPSKDEDALKEQSRLYTPERIVNIIKILSESLSMIKWSSNDRVVTEVTLIKISHSYLDSSIDGILDRVSRLESLLSDTSFIDNFRFDEPKPYSERQSETKNINKTIENSANIKPNMVSKKTKKIPTGEIAKIWDNVISQAMEKRRLLAVLCNCTPYQENNQITLAFEDEISYKIILEHRDLVKEVIDNMTELSVNIICIMKSIDEDDKFLEFIQKNEEYLIGD